MQNVGEEHRYARLIEGDGNARSVEVFDQIDQLSEQTNDEEQDILGALYDYAEMIVPVR